MTRRKVAPLIIALISLTLVSSFLIPSYPAPRVTSTPLGVRPQASFVPPSSQSGVGFQMSLTQSVNGWKANETMRANNTLLRFSYRNTSFSAPAPFGYSKSWQNLTVTGLTATSDVREVQGGTSPTGFLRCNTSYQSLAMRFVTLDKANLTGVWLYYSLSGSLTVPLSIISTGTTSTTTPNGGTTIGGGTVHGNGGTAGWYYEDLAQPITLTRGNYYWVVVNASSLTSVQFFDWFYVSEGGTADQKLAAGHKGGTWFDESTINTFDVHSFFNFMSMLKVLPVDSTGSNVKTYSSPIQVNMFLNATTQITNNVTRVSNSYRTFVLSANTSVTFAANWTARFEQPPLTTVSTSYIAKNGFTLWNASFTPLDKPTDSYTWYNLTFRVTMVPQFWTVPNPLTNITSTPHGYPFNFLSGPGYYFIRQTSNVNNTVWNDNWLVRSNSTYKILASLPVQVVAGLPLTLNVSTKPYSPSVCNVSFYSPLGDHVYSENIAIPLFSRLVTLKLNDTGLHTLFLFDTWNGGNEASLNRTLTINVLAPDGNITMTGRTSPVIGNTGALKFKFFNNTLGNVIIQPQAVSVNGTLTTNFAYDGASGNTTVYMSTGSGGWRTGNNTLMVSAKSGVYNFTKRTWIVVQRPLSNVTVVSVNQPFLSGTASLSFKFFNKTIGATPVFIDPASVKINGTSVSSTYSSGVVTTTWNTATGGWHVGLNHVNVSATRGIFSNYTVVAFTIIKPLNNVTVDSVNPPILGNPATAQFRFLNGTNGWASMSPTIVRINGTDMPFTYLGGVTTVSWDTTLGGWRSGLNHVNITAVHGAFNNFTVVQINIIQPTAKLTLGAISYSATYGDLRQISFMFLNTTLGSSSPLLAPAVYLNGSTIVYVHWTGAWYNYTLDTAAEFGAAQNWYLNFTAVYGEYVATNLTSIAVAHIPMQLSVLPGQTSVNVDSSYSVKANLTYTSGAPAPDGCTVRFVFSVTYTNGTVLPIVAYGTTTNGVAEASLLATSGMQSVAVEVFYDGSLILHATNKSAASIRVTVAAGLSIQVLLGIGVGGALVVIIPLAVIVRRRRSKETETRKTSVLRQTASLAQLIVVHVASGRSLFSRTIGSEEGADPNLISGFLSANQTLIGEVFKKQTGAGLKFADYGDYKVISDLGKHVMVTLFATETAGKELKDVLQSFTAKFENKYAKALESWDGDMNSFKDADALADEVFCLPLTAPYMLLENTSAKLGKVERMAVHSAKIISAERGVFFMPRVIDYLLTKQGIKRGKAMDVINSLTDKGIFRQLTVDQAAQVIKSYTEKAGAQE